MLFPPVIASWSPFPSLPVVFDEKPPVSSIIGGANPIHANKKTVPAKW
jgi:hypothetical protein